MRVRNTIKRTAPQAGQTLWSPTRLLLTGTSLSGFGALAWGLAVAPLPVGWVAAGLAAHAAVCTVGVIFPLLRAWADVAWRGTAGRAEVALTFDDGPHPETTRRVLALLREADAKATFRLAESDACGRIVTHSAPKVTQMAPDRASFG